jgi:hypothetical protein
MQSKPKKSNCNSEIEKNKLWKMQYVGKMRLNRRKVTNKLSEIGKNRQNYWNRSGRRSSAVGSYF